MAPGHERDLGGRERRARRDRPRCADGKARAPPLSTRPGQVGRWRRRRRRHPLARGGATCIITGMSGRFEMVTEMTPAGDQPAAIERLQGWLAGGAPACTLLGVTGSGKTFTVARLVELLARPTLLPAPPKTLRAAPYGQ